MAHTRRSSIAGFVLAAAGLTILGSHGPVAGAAPSGTTQANAPVAGKVGFIAAPAASVSLLNGTEAGAPGDLVTAAVPMTVESNKAYIVTVKAQAATMESDTTADSIDVGLMTTTVPGGGTAAISSSDPVTIASSATKSALPGGDPISSTLSLTIPWVEPGTYSVNLDYTVAQSS